MDKCTKPVVIPFFHNDKKPEVTLSEQETTEIASMLMRAYERHEDSKQASLDTVKAPPDISI